MVESEVHKYFVGLIFIYETRLVVMNPVYIAICWKPDWLRLIT